MKRIFTFKLQIILLILLFAAWQSIGQTYTFTNAGATGIDGPTQGQVSTAYSSTTLAGNVTVTAGIQSWMVPVSGTYKIEVYGANGYGPLAGRGAYMSGQFTLNASDELKILVGQKGGCCVASGTEQYGGGGGTFVVTSANVPMIIAGGGGGANGNTAILPTSDASITTAGNMGVGTGGGAGGINGSGGLGISSAGGGGGFSGDGGAVAGNPGGYSFLNGGVGGTATTSSGGWGGFGGGGGANSWNNRRGGGGGGYSGGGGGGSSTSSQEVGGGGGSYNTGTNQINTPALGTGEGLVVITLLAPAVSVPNNAGVVALPSLAGGACPGLQTITAKVRNFGNNAIDSVKVAWTVNGVLQSNNWYHVDLDTFPVANYDTIITLGTYTFTSGSFDVKAWTSLPNSQNDTVNINDTSSVNLVTKLAGIYTINSALPTAGTNYQSFADFTTALNTYGICGPVTANVSGGPFIEKVDFGNIDGSSATNYIKINGNGATVQFANTTTDRQLLTLSGTKYLTIDSLTFKTLATDYGWAALITAGAEHDSITNCFFDLTSVTSISSVNTNGITFSSSNTSATTAGTNGSHCYIGNNHLKWTDGTGGGYYNLVIAGTSDSNVIENNIFENYYMYGTYINGSTGTKLLNNEFHKQNKTASLTTFYGIYTTGIAPGLEIIGNRVHTPGGSAGGTGSFYGLYPLADGTPTDPIIIANNVIYDVNQNGILYGIYLSTSPYNLVYHNTIVFDKPLASTSATYGIYATGTNTNTEIKNNNIVITGGTSGIKYGFYYSTLTAVNDAQKNNFYLNSTQTGVQNYGYYTSAYTTQAAFQSAYPLLEVGSPTADPLFVNAPLDNFNVQSPQLIGNGVNLQSIVPFDINGNPRPGAPTIGAFEQPPSGSNNAGMLSFATPTGSYCAGQQSVSATFNNAGINNITSLKVNWTVNGVAQPQFSYSGTLVPITSTGANSATVVLGNATIPSGTPTVIKAWTSLPNGVADIFNVNDTIELNFQASHFFVEAVADSICVGGDAILSLNPSTGYNVGDLQWQTSTNGTSWTGIANSDDVDYSETNLLASKYFRVKIGSGSNICYSDSLQVAVIPVATPTVVSGERCGPGTVALSATGAAGNTLKWYDVITGGAPIATTPTFTTPVLNTTTNYWVSSSFASGTDSLSVPLVLGNTSGVYHHMFLVHSIAGLNITSIGIKCNNPVNTLTDWDIYYRPDNYQLVPGANTSSTGWILLSSVTGVPSLGTNEYTEIALNLSLNIPASATYSIYIAPVGGATHQYASTPQGTVSASNAYGEIIAGNRGSSLFSCTTTSGQAIVKLGYSSGCEGPRQMVTATIKPQPIVDLGNDTAICSNASLTLNAGNSGSTFLWNNNSTGQTLNISAAGTYSVTVTGANLCSNSDTINVAVGVAPLNNLPATFDLCFGDTITLDAGNPGSTYLWSNAATTQTTDISAAGSYNVVITSIDGCDLTSSTTVTSRALPIVDLGVDTAICSGDQIMLDAGNPGLNYLWNSGVNTQTITVNAAGTYSVAVTSVYNCKGKDTIVVTILPLPTVDAFSTVDLSAQEAGKIQFNAVNPQNVTGYEWDFGDNTPHSFDVSPTHTYTSNGTFTVILTVSNSCGEASVNFTVTIAGVGIAQIDNQGVDFTLYPNPTRTEVIITNKSTDAQMQQISIVNVLGAIVYENATNGENVQKVDVSKLASGLYTARILTDKGLVIRKFEVIK